MQPQRVIEYVLTPDDKELVLYQRGDVFQIDVDGYDLMTSRAHGSEEALATLALDALAERCRRSGALKILIGGFGMGFTLRAALDALDTLGSQAHAMVEVAEMFQAVVDWNVRHLGHLAGHPIQDRRVTVTIGDVGDCLRDPEPLYDVVILDVDNGPEALTLDSNAALYSERGLARMHRALADGGVLAVWSSFPDPRFSHRLRKAGFEAAMHRVRSRPGADGRKAKGQRNVVFLGVRA